MEHEVGAPSPFIFERRRGIPLPYGFEIYSLYRPQVCYIVNPACFHLVKS